MNILHFSKLDSTNTYLKKNCDILNDSTVVYVAEQTNGHGRYNRVWESMNNANLLCSILLKNLKEIKDINSLSLLTGVVIYKLLIRHHIKNVKIKWPNDIYVNDKKICGILLESVSMNNQIKAVIIGIGLNLNQRQFMNQKATSYVLELGKTIQIPNIINEMLDIFNKELNDYKKQRSNYIQIINNNNYLFNKKGTISINDQSQIAIISDVNLDNSLNVIINNKKQKLKFGEIVLLN